MRRTTGVFESQLETVMTGDELIAAQRVVRKVPVPDHVMDYVLDLVRATRPDEAPEGSYVKDMIEWGGGAAGVPATDHRWQSAGAALRACPHDDRRCYWAGASGAAPPGGGDFQRGGRRGVG